MDSILAFVQQLVHPKEKKPQKTSKLRIIGPFWGESTAADDDNLRHKAPVTRKAYSCQDIVM